MEAAEEHGPFDLVFEATGASVVAFEAMERRGPGDEYIDLVRAYMQTEPYLKAIRKRKAWIEPLFAEGKLWHGMRRFRTRRLAKTNAEALLIATGQNVKRLLAFRGRGPKKLAQAAALQPPARPLPDLPRHRFVVHNRE